MPREPSQRPSRLNVPENQSCVDTSRGNPSAIRGDGYTRYKRTVSNLDIGYGHSTLRVEKCQPYLLSSPEKNVLIDLSSVTKIDRQPLSVPTVRFQSFVGEVALCAI